MSLFDVLLTLSLLALFPLIKWIKPHLKLYFWRRHWHIKERERDFHALFQEVNGFALSKKARLENDSLEYVYGEIDFQSFIAALSLCYPDKNTVFYDLGSGTGKAVIAAAMVFPLKKSCGIELLAALHQTAMDQKQKLFALPNYNVVAKHIEFYQADLFNFSWFEANLLFINATAFFAERWYNLSKELENLAPKSVVLSTSKPVASQLFILKNKIPLKVSWGIVSVYVQERL